MVETSDALKSTGVHKIDSDTHFIITTNKGFRLHKLAGGALVHNCEAIPGGLSLC